MYVVQEAESDVLRDAGECDRAELREVPVEAQSDPSGRVQGPTEAEAAFHALLSEREAERNVQTAPEPLAAPQSPPEGAQYLPLNRKLRRALVAQERRARGLRRRQGTSLWLPRLKHPPTLAQSEYPSDDRERASTD